MTMPVRSVVLTKGVPDFREGKVSFDEDGHLERGNTPTVMNPNDRHALRAALQTKVRHEGTVSLLAMGPPGYAAVLQEGMRDVYADDLYLLSDREMGAADTWATSITLATGIAHLQEPPDLVFAGFKTADGETGHTGPQTSWCLTRNDTVADYSLLTHVVALDVDADAGTVRAKRLVEGDVAEVETVESDLPAFVVTDPEFEPSYRRAEYRLRHGDLREDSRRRAAEFGEYVEGEDVEATDWEGFHMWDHTELNLDPDFIGLSGSPTIVAGVDPIPRAPSEREVTMVTPDDDAGMETVVDELAAFAGGE